MAAPPQVTTKMMSGKFTLNKSLSDSAEEVLHLQGVSWFKRNAISLFTPNLRITHTMDGTGEKSTERLDIVQTLSGGKFSAVHEVYNLDWTPRDKSHYLFGALTGRSRRAPVDEVEGEDAFLGAGWTEDTREDGIVVSEHWSTPGKNACVWKAVQAWGFAVVNGERRYVRRTTFTSPQKRDGPICIHFVYDYAGEIDGANQ